MDTVRSHFWQGAAAQRSPASEATKCFLLCSHRFELRKLQHPRSRLSAQRNFTAVGPQRRATTVSGPETFVKFGSQNIRFGTWNNGFEMNTSENENTWKWIQLASSDALLVVSAPCNPWLFAWHPQRSICIVLVVELLHQVVFLLWAACSYLHLHHYACIFLSRMLDERPEGSDIIALSPVQRGVLSQSNKVVRTHFSNAELHTSFSCLPIELGRPNPFLDRLDAPGLT